MKISKLFQHLAPLTYKFATKRYKYFLLHLLLSALSSKRNLCIYVIKEALYFNHFDDLKLSCLS